MAEKRKPLMEGYPPRCPNASSSLFMRPWQNSYPSTSPSTYFHPASSNRPVYPIAHYMNGYPLYSYSPSMYPNRGYGSRCPTPLNLGGGRPLLPRPPPLMQAPHMYGHHGRVGFHPQQHPQGPQGYSAQSVPPVSSQSQKSSNEEAEQAEHQSSTQRLVPLMPSVPAEFLSHPKFIKTFSFFKDCDGSEGLHKGEMVIRGYLYDIDASGAKGYLKSGSNLKVEINREFMYIMGRKMGSDENLRDVLAERTNIKAFVKEVLIDDHEHMSKPKEEGDAVEQSAVRYRAVLAWFGEIPSIRGLTPTVVTTQDLEKAVGVGGDSSSESNSSDRSEESSETKSDETSSEIAHILGYVWWADKDRGIMRIYQAKGWGSDFSGILFRAKVLHFQNQQTRCDTLHFLVAHLNKCDVQARRIRPRVVHGMVVNWEAMHIECGDLHNLVLRKEPGLGLSEITHDNKRNGADSNSLLKYDDSVNGQLSACMKKQNALSSYSDRKSYDCSSFVDNKNSFRDVAARNGTKMSLGVEKKGASSTEKSWLSEDLYFMKDLRISCDTDMEELQQSGKVFEVLFRNKYSGKHLTGRIIKLFSSHVGIGVAQWKSMDYGDVNIIFKQNDLFVDLIPINKIMQLSSSLQDRRCNLYVLPVKGQDCLGYRIQLVATCGWLGTKPSCIPIPGEQPRARILLNHLESVTPAEGGNASEDITLNQRSVNASLSFNPSLSGNTAGVFKKKTSVSRSAQPPVEVVSFDGEEDDSYQSGEIVEVHCKIGKLLSSEGEYHYFNREQCFLFGINLCYVELWHVLVHGQKILFTLEKHPKVKAKIDKVFIGSRDDNGGANTDIEHFVEWCKNNAVTECAKDILVKQLQKT